MPSFLKDLTRPALVPVRIEIRRAAISFTAAIHLPQVVLAEFLARFDGLAAVDVLPAVDDSVLERIQTSHGCAFSLFQDCSLPFIYWDLQ